ncbi:hypothetical protein [Roseomonas sp. BN140053]|uniref:hypothetical protein n=1 Tax=Roseomonas sp. BN140053 TaxID=3391898 RepID=UPI0039EBD8E8
MLQALTSGGSVATLLLAFFGFWGLLGLLRFQRRGVGLNTGLIPRFGRSSATGTDARLLDDAHPHGEMLAGNLDVEVIVHYVAPSGKVAPQAIRMARIYGERGPQGMQISGIMAAPKPPVKLGLMYQFYRIRALEEPHGGATILDEVAKACWIAEAGGLLRAPQGQHNDPA